MVVVLILALPGIDRGAQAQVGRVLADVQIVDLNLERSARNETSGGGGSLRSAASKVLFQPSRLSVLSLCSF